MLDATFVRMASPVRRRPPRFVHALTRPNGGAPPAALLVAVPAVALAIRAVVVVTSPPVLFYGSDNTWYDATATSFATGHLGRLPGLFAPRVLSLKFPPGYPLVMAVGQRLLFWVQPFWAHLWTSVLLGSAGAVVVAVLAWRLADRADRPGRVVAAAVAGLVFAANPLVVGQSTSLMSEALYVPLVALFLLGVDRAATDGRGGVWLYLAGLLAYLGITRPEVVVLLAVALVVPGARRRTSGDRRRVAGVLASGLGLAVLWSVLASGAAHRVVFVSVNSGSVLLGANCPESWHGDLRGLWSVDCLSVPSTRLSPAANQALAQKPFPIGLPPQAGARIEAEINAVQLHEALRAITHQPGAAVGAVPFRWARAVGLFWDGGEARLEYFEGKSPGWERAGRWLHETVLLPLLLVAGAGLAWPRSRLGTALRQVVEPHRLLPGGMLLVAWLVLVALTEGSIRVRAPVEPVVAVLAGIGVAALGRAVRAGTALPSTPPPDPRPAAVQTTGQA